MPDAALNVCELLVKPDFNFNINYMSVVSESNKWIVTLLLNDDVDVTYRKSLGIFITVTASKTITAQVLCGILCV